MFPLNSNDQYIDENGKRSSLGTLFEGSEHDIEELETTVAGHTTKIGALETLTGALQDQINPDEYSAESGYTEGDYVIHDNKLYKCNTSCNADTWENNSSNFTATSVANELDNLAYRLSNLNNSVKKTVQFIGEDLQSSQINKVSDSRIQILLYTGNGPTVGSMRLNFNGTTATFDRYDGTNWNVIKTW